MFKVVGLTGLIGSGKSKVGQLLLNIGVPVVDVDVINKNLLDNNEMVKNKITSVFGSSYMNNDYTINKNQLRDLIFSNNDARVKLQNIMHPIIFDEVKKYINNNKELYVVIIVPLLFNSKLFLNIINRSIFVDCKRSILIKRIIARNQFNEKLIKNILRTQMPRYQQIIMADDKIDNNGDEILLEQKVLALHKKYLNIFSGTL